MHRFDSDITHCVEWNCSLLSPSQCCHLLLPSICYLRYPSTIHLRDALLRCSSATPYAGNFNVSGNLVVGGAITAQTLHVQTITSSVIYSSGSNIFGDSTADTQTLNGTVSVSGSFNVTGSATINNLTGSLFGTASWALNAISSSYANNATTASYALNSELLDGLDSTGAGDPIFEDLQRVLRVKLTF